MSWLPYRARVVAGNSVGNLKAATLEGLHPAWTSFHGGIDGVPSFILPDLYPLVLPTNQVQLEQNCIHVVRIVWILQ